MPAGQIIGRVSVKVLPDTSTFRKEAKAKLAVIEQGLKFVIPTTLDITGAKRDLITAVRAVNAENRAMASRKIRFYAQISTDGMRSELATYRREATALSKTNPVKIQAELTAANAKLELDKSSLEYVKQQLEHWRRGVDPLKIGTKVEYGSVSADIASVRLAWLARDRFVTLFPRVSGAASREVATLLSALSGARMLQSTWNNIWDMFKNLDKVVPMIALVGNAIGLLGASVLSSSSNIFALAASIGSIAAVGLVMPGILAGVVMGLGLTLLAFKGIKTYMPGLYKEWTSFKELATKDFWSTASAGVQKLATVYLPQLATTAKVLGTFWGGLASALSKPFHSALSTMFDNLNKSIGISTAGTGVFADVITKLGLAGSAYLPRLATWFVNISTTFDKWLGKISADGTMKRWVDQGIVALHDLGRVLTSSIDVLADLGRAAQAAGGSTLGMLADSLAHLHAVTAGPTFQRGMADAFRAAHEAMSLIANISGPAVSAFFLTFSRTLTTLLPIIGTTLGDAFKALASAMSQPAFQTGLIAMFVGIQKGIEALVPIMPSLGVAFGKLMEIIGTLATNFGPLLAGFLQAITDGFLALAPTISNLIPILSGGLLKVVVALAPGIVAVANALVPLVISLVPALVALVTTLAPILVNFAPLIADLILGLGAVQLLGKAWDVAMIVGYFGQMVWSMATTLGELAVYVAGNIAACATVAAGWLSTAAAATYTGITMAAAWVIGLGPVAWVIAAVVAIGAAIVAIATQTTWLQTVWEYTWGAIQRVVGVAVGVIVTVFRTISDVFAAVIGGILSAAATVAETLHLPFASAMRQASDAFTAAAVTADAAMSSIATSALGWGTQTGTNLTASLPAVSYKFTEMSVGAKADMGTIPPAATTFAALLPAPFAGATSAVSTSFKTMTTGANADMATTAPAAVATAAQVSPPFAGATSAVLTAFKTMTTNAKADMATIPPAANTSGVNTGVQYAGGLASQNDRATTTARVMAESVKHALTFNAFSIGASIGDGLIGGMNIKYNAVVAAAAALAAGADNAMARAAQVKSPSKVTLRIGMSIGEGLALGMDRMRTAVRKSASALGSEITGMTIQAPSMGLVGVSTQGVSSAFSAAYAAAEGTSPSGASGPYPGATSADIAALGDRLGAELQRHARAIQTLQRQGAK